MARHLTPLQDKVWHGACWEMKLHELGWQMAHGFLCQAKCLRIDSRAMWSHCQISSWYIYCSSGNDTSTLYLEDHSSRGEGETVGEGSHTEVSEDLLAIEGWLKMSWGLHEDKYISESYGNLRLWKGTAISNLWRIGENERCTRETESKTEKSRERETRKGCPNFWEHEQGRILETTVSEPTKPLAMFSTCNWEAVHEHSAKDLGTIRC